MSFSYGDVVQDLSPGDALVSLAVADVSGSGQGGHIWGRYLTAANSGPSGLFEVKAKPSTSRPAMTLMKGEAFSGYFSGFALEFLPLEYYINGQPVFSKGMTLTDFQSLESANAALTSVTLTSDGFEVLGFYGDAAFTSSNFVNNDGACTGGEYTTCLKSTSEFTGPFKPVSGPFLDVSGTTYSWSFLPNLTSVIDGAKVYRINTAATDTSTFEKNFVIDENLFNCAYLQQNTSTFVTLLATVAAGTDTYDIGTPLDPDEILAVCPYKGDTLYGSALTDPDLGPGGGGGSGGGPYLRFEIANGQYGGLVQNSCEPVYFKMFEFNGVSADPYLLIDDLEITFDAGSPLAGRLYLSDLDCATSTSPQSMVTVTSGFDSSDPLYLKVPTSSFTISDATLDLASNPGPDPEVYIGHSTNEVFTVGAATISIEGPSPIVTGQCYQMNVVRKRPSGMWFYDNTNLAVSISTSSPVLYSDSSCTSASTTAPITIASNNASEPFYIKMGTATSLTLTASASGFSSTTKSMTALAQNTALARFMIVAVSTPVVATQCEEFRVYTVNGDGTVIPAPEFYDLDVSASQPGGIGLYSDGGCSSALSLVSINQGSYSTSFFVKSNVVGSTELHATSGTITSLSPSNVPFSTTFSAPSVSTDEPWVTIAAPTIKALTVGTHEFPKTVQLASANLTSIQCYRDFPTYDPCGSEWNPVAKTLLWTAQDAVDGVEFEFIGHKNGWPDATVMFNQDDFYGMDFTIADCTVTVTDLSTASSAISGAASGAVVCLGAGSQTLSGTINIPDERMVIGKLAADGATRATTLVSSGAFSIFTLDYPYSPTAMKIANLNLTLNDAAGASTSPTAVFADAASGAGVLDLTSEYNSITVNSVDENRVGALLVNHQGLYNSVYDLFTLGSLSTSPSNTAVGIKAAGGYTAYATSTRFQMNSTSGKVPVIAMYGVGDTNGTDIRLDRSGIFGNGTAFKLFSGAAGDNVIADIWDSQIAISSSSESASFYRYLVTATGNHNLSILRSRVQTSLPNGAAMIATLDGNTDPYGISHFYEDNLFIQEQDKSLISFYEPTPYSVGVSATLSENHFVRTTTTGVTAPIVQGNLGANYLDLKRVSVGDPSDGKNKICANLATRQWSSMYSGNTLASNSDSITAPSPGSFTLATTTLRCQ